MSNCKNIVHDGVVKSVEQGMVYVVIPVQEACMSCKANEICGSGSAEQRVVCVKSDMASDFQVDDQVVVTMSENSGFFAIFLAYILPFILIFGTLLLLLTLHISEAVSGLTSLSVGAVYYVLLWIFNKFVAEKVKFDIIHKS